MSIVNCNNCKQSYEITKSDLAFYRRINTPAPTFCPECRRQRRFAFRNERNLYIRKCDFSGKQIVTTYSPDKPFKVYAHDVWWSDQWDPLEYGQEFDFNKPFFEQYKELLSKVPRMDMIIVNSENSDYAPYSVNSKNCYMCVSSNYSEDVYYSYQTNFSRDSLDCLLCNNCELCYESVYGVNLYHCMWTVNCRESSDLFFCRDCQGCQKCIGCANLKNKNLYAFNKQVSEAEYESLVKLLTDRKNIKKMRMSFDETSLKFPYRANYNINCEDVSGDHLRDCKNSENCFDAGGLEDCKYVYVLPKGGKDIYDGHYSQNSELVYDCVSAVNDYDCKWVIHTWDVKNSMYCDECYYSDNLFGCIGLRRKKFCILNKQYSEQEYKELLPRIIDHMKGPSPRGEGASGFATAERSELKNSEFGEFFPIEISPFCYNESLAGENSPLTKEQVIAKNLKWKEKDSKEYKPASYQPVDNIGEVKDDILNEILACKDCGKNYRVILQELRFYRKNKLLVPVKCQDCRYKERMKFRNPFKLFQRNCAKCGMKIETTYEPVRPEIVYCEKCYLEALN